MRLLIHFEMTVECHLSSFLELRSGTCTHLALTRFYSFCSFSRSAGPLTHSFKFSTSNSRNISRNFFRDNDRVTKSLPLINLKYSPSPRSAMALYSSYAQANQRQVLLQPKFGNLMKTERNFLLWFLARSFPKPKAEKVLLSASKLPRP